MQLLKKIFYSIGAYALPSACIACGEFQKLAICKKCLELLKHEGLLAYECCTQCGITLKEPEIIERVCSQCINHPPCFDATFCLDRYDGILQEGLHQFKYQKRVALAHGLASAWNQLCPDQLMGQFAHYLLPVPLSSEKLAARGFNQSWELAKLIHCRSTIQKSPYILKRHHYSKHQAGTSAAHRHLLIQGMFYIEPMHLELLENKIVIVFDDVMTSGATLNEIASILKDNGVSRVINWVLLRTSRST